MRKKLCCLGIVAVMLCGAMCLTGCEGAKFLARKHIKDASQVEVPKDAKIVFHNYQQNFQGGEIILDTVFKFETEPTDWLQENEFSEEKSSDLEGRFRYYFQWFGKIKMPEEYFPDFEKPYMWLFASSVYFVYQPDTLMLIVHKEPFTDSPIEVDSSNQ